MGSNHLTWCDGTQQPRGKTENLPTQELLQLLRASRRVHAGLGVRRMHVMWMGQSACKYNHQTTSVHSVDNQLSAQCKLTNLLHAQKTAANFKQL